jgi:hypothetical protein
MSTKCCSVQMISSRGERRNGGTGEMNGNGWSGRNGENGGMGMVRTVGMVGMVEWWEWQNGRMAE